MDRATQLQERLGVSDRPSSSVRSYPAPAREEPTLVREEPTLVHEEPTLVHEEPTLVHEEPTLVHEEPTLVHEEPTLVHEEPTLEFRTEFLDEADISATEGTLEEPAPDVGSERVRDDESFDNRPRATSPAPSAPPRTSELDIIPDFRRRQLGPATVIAAIGAAIALVAVSVGSHRFPPRVEPTSDTGTQHVAKEPVLRPAPEPRSAAAAAAAITPVNLAVNARDSLQQAPVATSLENNSNAVAVTITVTVTVIPAGAVVFRAGQKLGTGTVQVSVDHHAKQRLTALHDGYAPYNFPLDGSRDSVTVRLKRAPRLEAPAPVSDSPVAGPSEGSSEGAAETPAE